MELSIIVPLYGRSDLSGDLCSALSPYMTTERELILVDNNSADNTLDVVKVAKRLYHYPIKLLSLPKNLGFGAANNRGVLLAESERIILMSNDVQILGDIIRPVIEYMDKNQRTAFGPRIINFDSGWNKFDRFGVIPYVEGFFLAIHKQDFQMVGGFDEAMFIDYEDMELCLRLHMAGIGLAQINLPVMHQLGGSFGGLNKSRLEYTLQSQKYFEQKWACKKI